MVDLEHIREIVKQAIHTLPEGQYCCHEAATRCAEFLQEKGHKVVVRHGLAAYSVNFLADKISEDNDKFGIQAADTLRSSLVKQYVTVHSWCEIGDIVVDCHPYVDLGDVWASGLLMIHKKGEAKDTDVRYLWRGFHFSLGNNRFVVVPTVSRWWRFLIPFRLIKLKI